MITITDWRKHPEHLHIVSLVEMDVQAGEEQDDPYIEIKLFRPGQDLYMVMRLSGAEARTLKEALGWIRDEND